MSDYHFLHVFCFSQLKATINNETMTDNVCRFTYHYADEFGDYYKIAQIWQN